MMPGRGWSLRTRLPPPEDTGNQAGRIRAEDSGGGSAYCVAGWSAARGRALVPGGWPASVPGHHGSWRRRWHWRGLDVLIVDKAQDAAHDAIRNPVGVL